MSLPPVTLTQEVVKNGITPLMMACVHGSDALIRLLLAAGADCSTVDKRNNSVYHAAALHGRDDVLQLLIRYGSPLDIFLATTQYRRAGFMHFMRRYYEGAAVEK
ncbi:ankyrin repeat protein [Oesophagostomum dentatum]|uniref:Ankyrin repeat protein n=1 Tax=Oesophagostomum dentatum TaxID=61180 RepID=A0A0B1TGY8_OESDE|nr:ankyrin repeat protein [Oesophagostomum dentatum]